MAGSSDKETRIRAALAAYHNGEFPSPERAADAYSVPPRTLRRRAQGGLSRSEGRAAFRRLTEAEELEMVKWIEELTERNIPARVGMLNGMANVILKSRQPQPDSTAVGVPRYQGFLDRHPNLHTRFSRAIDHARAVAITKPLVDDWLNLWQKTMEEYSITLDTVYNMDETGIMMGVLGRSLVVIPRAQALRYMKQPGNKNWVSVLETISGTNTVLPPFLIFKGAHHQLSWYPVDAPKEWRYAISDNGWTNDELGYAWLREHFEPNTRPRNNQYRLLLLDGHSSHCTYEFLHHCRLHRIIVLCLPAHSTHRLQPLDVACFQSLKTHYQHAIEQESRRGITNIEKHRFIHIYKQARLLAFDERHIMMAWKDTGLIPFNRRHLFSLIPECRGRTRPVTPPPPQQPLSSSPLSDLTVSTQLVTPKTLNELEHFHQRYQEFISFGSIDMSPSQRRYDKIIRSAQQALTGYTVMQQRYNQLLEETRRSAITRRKRRQIDTSGVVLTAEVLEQLDYERWLYEEGTSSESEVDEDIGTVMELTVIPGVREAEADQIETQGLKARCSFFHAVPRSSGGGRGGTGQTESSGGGRGGGAQRGTRRGRGDGNTGRRGRGSTARGSSRGRGGRGGRGQNGGVASV